MKLDWRNTIVLRSKKIPIKCSLNVVRHINSELTYSFSLQSLDWTSEPTDKKTVDIEFENQLWQTKFQRSFQPHLTARTLIYRYQDEASFGDTLRHFAYIRYSAKIIWWLNIWGRVKRFYTAVNEISRIVLTGVLSWSLSHVK